MPAATFAQPPATIVRPPVPLAARARGAAGGLRFGGRRGDPRAAIGGRGGSAGSSPAGNRGRPSAGIRRPPAGRGRVAGPCRGRRADLGRGDCRDAAIRPQAPQRHGVDPASAGRFHHELALAQSDRASQRRFSAAAAVHAGPARRTAGTRRDRDLSHRLVALRQARGGDGQRANWACRCPMPTIATRCGSGWPIRPAPSTTCWKPRPC